MIKSISERDADVLWHPYTQMKIAPLSIAIEKAEGAYLFDENGKKYIDAISSWWVNMHGHAHPEIANAISEQAHKLEQVIFAGFTHQPAVELAERLLPLLPKNQKKIFLSDNGSTAVEAALKMCIQFFANQGMQKTKIIAFKESYHGDTFGSMSVSARDVFTKPFRPLLFDVVFIDTPTASNANKVVAQFQKAVDEFKDEICAFIFEPLVLGSGGMLMYGAEVLNQLMSLAKQHQIFCIADEVMTGFGRTGKFFASEYLNIEPDIICLSKGITGGFLPLGATTTTKEIYDAFYSSDKYKMLFHGHSYTGNPLACAAAVASLNIWEKENTLEKIKQIELLNKNFVEKISKHPKVKNARFKGTIMALEINSDKGDYLSPIKEKVVPFYIENGVLLRPLGNTVYTLPPYCISEKDLNYIFEIIEQSLDFV
ncbi:MAG: adenosylmethionine--8-amino-7-oxononanoate transaminase [Chitinophagales bacterium]|nr:adenosylmethionine--8-amino-7-oxononanoate transaminase [Chitinophagales bacterium]OJV30789.1 MAG: adenosylmethionine--8-amino-7-oxononanoate transaminase [Bacteroidetes bacterium 37-13]HRN94275.1 adenosylmethionine--8-amino-7-oxononanoate transaminase [Chitinophagales bacterium]